MSMLLVPHAPFFNLLTAVIGEPHLIRELQATRDRPELGLSNGNPIDELLKVYNEWARKHPDSDLVVAWHQPNDEMLRTERHIGGEWIMPTPDPDLAMTNPNLIPEMMRMPLSAALKLQERYKSYRTRGEIIILQEVQR